MTASPPPHPTDQILYAYGLGKLGDPAASAVDIIWRPADACRQRVSELSGDSFVSRLRDAGARPDTPAPTGAPGPAAAGGVRRRPRPRTPHWPARSPRSWPTTRSTRCSASWAAAAWGSSTWRTTR